MNYHTIATGSASAKKGDAQPFRFAVNQSIPYPRFTDGGLDNLETLNPNKYRNHGGVRLSSEYVAYMLSSEYTEANHTGNRQDHAGYKHYQSDKVNPGTFQYRGADLGELTATVQLADCGRWEGVQWNGTGLTDGVRKWLNEQVAPVLLRHVKDHKATLRKLAIEALCERFTAQAISAMETVKRCKAEAAAIIDTLKKG